MLPESPKSVAVNGDKEVLAIEGTDDDDRKDNNSKADEVCKISGGDDDRTPKVGMVFKTYDEVVTFYKRYALHVGFGVAVKKSSFTTYGLCRRLVLVCTKGGKGRGNACYLSRPTAKTNCQAMIIAKLWGDGLLHLIEAHLEHNHPVSPSAARFLRCYKKMSSGMTKDPVVQRAGHEDSSYGDKEYTDSVEVGQIKLGVGGSEALHQFFAQMQAKQPNFFYLIDFDVEGHARNVFWADSRSRAAYQYFNDVVCVDTTCLRNNFDVPLVIFVGVNHHGQLVLLGCGLLSDESTESHLWLLKAWQTCMLGCAPTAIITDESVTLRAAIGVIFPKVRHRICLWHIMRSILDKFRGTTEYKTVKKELKNAVYDSLKDIEFDERWRNLIDRFGLQGHEWLQYLYENRHLWVPAFLKDTFWAGLSTVQHQKSLSSFFEGSITPKTTLKCYLDIYLIHAQRKYEMEAHADFESFNINRVLVSKFPMEEQLSKLYTLNIFRKFQDELKATLNCHALLAKIDGSISTFEVKECAFTEGGGILMNKSYEVVHSSEEFEVQCNCGSFQFNGILCRHALSVLKLQKVYEIPCRYVLYRWRRDFKQLHTLDISLEDVASNNQMERYDYLSMRCLRLVEVGMVSDEKYQLTLKLINEVQMSLLDDDICRELQRRLLPFERSIQSDDFNAHAQQDIFEGNKVPNSLPAKRRGRPPKKRKETNMETMLTESQNKETLRASSNGSRTNAFHSSSTVSHHGTHIRTYGGADLMEEVNPNYLSFGSHFGLHPNHQHHIANQLQSVNTLQFGQQAAGSHSRMQWIYQQMLQEDQAPIGRKTG
ncbi:protein FAR1-RELATED SEQUENCE 6-like isoform X1 [Typha angustifolia]|uniref:protein FAR1-RELATED SEQUENCE 6-like isoform X1 n=1 Tax=Typha angustifolia TaxID=59011 RepID=UPI003C2F76FC